jgi:hypothetical protein
MSLVRRIVLGVTCLVVVMAMGVVLLSGTPPSRTEVQNIMERSWRGLMIDGELQRTNRRWTKGKPNQSGRPYPGGICALFRVSQAELSRLQAKGTVIKPLTVAECWSGGPNANPDHRVCGPLVRQHWEHNDTKLVAFRCQGPDDYHVWINIAKKEALFERLSFE